MEDQVAGQPAPEASASAPAPAALDIDKIKADLTAAMTAEMDKRVGGFQTVINKLTEENKQLKRQSLPDDEREELDNRDAQDRIDALERQLALLQLQAQFPDIAPAYQSLLDAETPEQQIAILNGLRAAAKTPEAEPEVAEVDKNNPPQSVGEIVGRMPDGSPLTGEAAWEALRRLGPTATSEIGR